MTSKVLSTRTNFNSNPHHVYYDINMYNDDTSGNSAAVPVKFTETRNQPILANPSEYFMTVSRMCLDTASLPLMIPEVAIGENSNANKTVYQFAVGKYADDAGAKVFNIIFNPQDKTLSAPTLPITASSSHSDYYFTLEMI